MHEKDARLASGRWAVVHGNVAPGSDLDGLDEEAGFQGGAAGGHDPVGREGVWRKQPEGVLRSE